MEAIDKNKFRNPEAKYRANPMVHYNWTEDRPLFMQALKDYGYGGVVTNVNTQNGFCQNPKNIEDFGKLLDELDFHGLSYWIYDENGYPSGYAGGETLKGHPELEAKGFYMVRRVAYEPRTVSFSIDDETDKIVWAAKYPIETPGMHESFIDTAKMQAVEFSETEVKCELVAKEALFVFCVKPAYEGSHCVHNVCSFARYINIMDPMAVRRFLELCYEPIAAAIPDAFRRAGGVFTDEPSLQIEYVRSYESWPYALAPWTDGLFEEFEAEYGFSLLPQLPYIFEGRPEDAYAVRVKFYRLVGKLIARAFSGQIADWCEARGGIFSGHYMSEELMWTHVKFYGDFLEVLKAASYPGIDVLCCYPEIYNYNTAKYVQMAARKKGTNGMMVELCPFADVETFKKDPIENMTGVVGLLYLGGVRVTHSYFGSDFSGYSPKFAGYRGYMDQNQSIAFNEYVGRLGYMLDGTPNECGTFIYYGIEDIQAKIRPAHSQINGPEVAATRRCDDIMKAIYEAGHDFYYIDKEDLMDAAASLSGGLALISGNEVKTVIVPPLDVIYEETLEALLQLKDAGVNVVFVDRLPSRSAETGSETAAYTRHFAPCGLDGVLGLLNEGARFVADAGGAMLIKARYTKNGHEMYFVDNNTRNAVFALLDHAEKKAATVYDPLDGSIYPVNMGERIKIASFRGVFVVFE